MDHGGSVFTLGVLIVFEHDVEGARDAHDFSEARDGSSIWCATKSRAITIQTAFHNWMNLNRTRLRPNIEKVSQSDRNGKGYRVYFYEFGPAQHEDADIERWAHERTKKCARQPACGWHLTSDFYADYKAWHADNGGEYELKNITKFSQGLCELPGVRRVRQSAGTTFHGIAFNDDEEFNPYGADRTEPAEPMHADLRAAMARQQEELAKYGYGKPKPKRPETIEEFEKMERLRSITSPCARCEKETMAVDLSDAGMCRSCVRTVQADADAVAKLAETDPEAAFKAKLAAKARVAE